MTSTRSTAAHFGRIFLGTSNDGYRGLKSSERKRLGGREADAGLFFRREAPRGPRRKGPVSCRLRQNRRSMVVYRRYPRARMLTGLGGIARAGRSVGQGFGSCAGRKGPPQIVGGGGNR